MRKVQFYLLTTILAIVSTLFTFKIATLGDGNIVGGLIVGALSFLVIFAVYRGFTPVKWIGLIGFSLLAFGTLMAGLEHADFTFYTMTLGYAFLAWQIVSISSGRSDEVRDDESKVGSQKVPPLPNTFETGNNVYAYPPLLKRVQALSIDGILLLVLLIIIMLITEGSPNAITIRITAWLTAAFLYEPLLTVYSGTIGQRVIGISVRSSDDPSKSINLLQAYARTFVKALLGWLSFITIHFNDQHRAIHDFAGSSVMIKRRK